MRGVRISGIDLDSDGRVAVEKLADIFEDGEVVGSSYLASSLRKSVAERGPTPLSTVIRRFNNGYFGAAWMYKGRVYIKEDSEAPEGARVEEGPRGGKYYETKARRGRPLTKPPRDYVPAVGERIRIVYPGDELNGHLARVEGVEPAGNLMVSILDYTPMMRVLQKVPLEHTSPAPYTRKEKREMKARDILIQEFDAHHRYASEEEDGVRVEHFDAMTELEYDIFDTKAGVELWIKSKPDPKKPWMADKESAVSAVSFLRALPEMSTEALTTMKRQVKKIVFSPVGNPHDRKHSQSTGRKFTSRACMEMQFREMHIFPAAKDLDSKALADMLTHETGHAQDYEREDMVDAYNLKLHAAWDVIEEKGTEMPADPDRMRKIEEDHGIPPHPNDWMHDYGNWLDFDAGVKQPDRVRFWGSMPHLPKEQKKTGNTYVMIGQKSWNDLTSLEKRTVSAATRAASPVSMYAQSNAREYYAEAYLDYQRGRLSEKHLMYKHFKRLPEIRRWAEDTEYVKEEAVPWPAD